MTICQNCKALSTHGQSVCVFIAPSHTIYLCLDCAWLDNGTNYRDLPPVYECKQCGSANELYPHCFTCINVQILWSMRTEKVGN